MAETALNILLTLKDQATKGLETMNTKLGETKDAAEKTKAAWDAIGKAATGISVVGAAGLAVVQTNKDLNTSLSLTGVTVGKTKSEMQSLATDTADAGFTLNEVAATFDVLSKAGVTNTDQMVASAKAFDSLADATGGQADSLASTLIPGFKALGEQIPDTSEGMDQLTWLANNTGVTLEDFGSVMDYVAKDGQGLNLSSADIVKSLAALEKKGITGTAATRKFRTAVNDAAQGNGNLNEALGLTNEEVASFDSVLGDATGATDKYADAAEGNITLIDKLKEGFSEAALKATKFLEPLQPIMAAMTALAPAIMAVKAATEAWKIAQAALDIVLNANPIGLIVIAIAALIAIVAVIIMNWDKISAYFSELWEFVKYIFQTAIDAIVGFLQTAWDTIKGAVETAWNAISGFFTTVWDGIKGIFTNAWSAIKGVWDGAITFFGGIPGKIGSAFSTILNTVTAPFRTAWDTIRGWIDTAMGWFRSIAGQIGSALSSVVHTLTAPFRTAWDTIRGWIDTAMGWFRSIPGQVGGALGNLWGAFTQPFRSAIDTIRGWLNTLFGWIADIPNKISSALGSAGNLLSAGWNAITPWATGGVITGPTLLTDMRTGKPYAVAGEAGPEAVVPVGAMGGGGGGGGVTYVVNISAGAFVGDRAGADQFADFILDSLRTKQRYSYGAAQF